MIVAPEGKAHVALMAKMAADILGEDLETFGFDRHGDPLFGALAFAVEGEIACVVVAYQYAKPNVVFAIAATDSRWATRTNIEALGTWAFEDMDCERITAFIQKSNRRSRKFVEGIGFQHEGKLRRATDKGDVIVYGLLRDEHINWLRKAYGRQRLNDSRSP